jgi:D-threo-aldose 1-dehydrogenase
MARAERPAFPALGFGAAAIGNLYQPVSDAAAHEAVRAALEQGVRYFDTAPYYGFGLSESRLGAALAEFDPAQKALVSTKVGRRLEPIAAEAARGERHGFVDAAPFEPVFDYGYDAMMRSYEESRRRLRRDRIDVLLAHDLGRRTHGEAHEAQFRSFMTGGYRALRELRDAGAVGAIGLGVNEWEVAEAALNAGEFDVVLLAGRYTLLEQGAVDSFLPLCARQGVSVIVGGPFNSGVLVERESATGGHYDYAPASEAVLERVARLRAVCGRFGVPLAAAALQFPLAHPQVVSVVAGLADAGQLAQAVEWLGAPAPDAFWRALSEEGLLHAAASLPKTREPAPFLALHPDDNVVVLRAPVRRGERLSIDGRTVFAGADVEVGHKLARRRLAVDERVFKYGAPIGSMREAVEPGAHVHMHNMRSDYISSHTRDAVHSTD